jgi:D-alanine transaminase
MVPRIVYVSGRYVPYAAARVHIDDRGYTFADGVYEVVLISAGKLIDERPHLDRLERSLRELRMDLPMPRRALELVLREVIRRNNIGHGLGLVYLQMSRAVAPRDHPFPAAPKTQFVAWAKAMPPQPAAFAADGVKAISVPDNRWGRCDIKSTGLLPNVLAKQAAREAGAYEAWLVDGEGFVTEGSSTNAWIITPAGELVTRGLDNGILAGVTRRTVVALARDEGLRFVERRFSLAEAKAAREAFVTSASSFVLPVTQIDEAVIGNGKPGSLSLALRARYLKYATEDGEGRRP